MLSDIPDREDRGDRADRDNTEDPGVEPGNAGKFDEIHRCPFPEKSEIE